LTTIRDIATRMATEDASTRDLRTKRLVQQLAHAVTAAILVENAGTLASETGNYRGLAQSSRYMRRNLLPPRNGMADEIDPFALDHFDAIIDWSPAMSAQVATPLIDAMEAEAIA
jgi:hypothetical protein